TTCSNPGPSGSGPGDAAAGLSLSRSSAVWPGATVSWYQNAHLVPVRAGLTVGAPLITWSPMPSLGYGVAHAVPYSRSVLVSFSQNSRTGPVVENWLPPGTAPAVSSISPRNG